MIPIRAVIWTIIAVIFEGVIFSSILGPSLLLHGNFFTRAFVTIVVSITGYVCFLFYYNPKIQTFQNKAVVITGCDTGFGHRLAKRLDGLGFTVFATCLNVESKQAQDLKTDSGRLHLLPMNVTSDEQVQDCVKRVVTLLKNESKYLWAVVNNAGIGCVGFHEMHPMSQYEEVFRVNALGTVRVSKAFIPLLRGHGRIINVTSLSSRLSFPYFGVYSMSKFATLAFSDSLRREMLPFNVKVVTIEPGRYKTSILDSDKNMAGFNGLWSNSPEHVRAAYGCEFFEACGAKLAEHLRDAQPNIDEVVDIMTEAVTAVVPKTSYIPNERIFWFFTLLYSLPDRVLDKMLLKNMFPESMVPAYRTAS